MHNDKEIGVPIRMYFSVQINQFQSYEPV